MSRDKDNKNKGYSREGWFGIIHHYDDKGHKIGESRPGLFGGYTDYDSKGHKIGTSEEHFFGGGFTHYDNKGHKTGSSDERLFGGYTTRDADGHVTGSVERSVFDIKSPDEIVATGSLYGSNAYSSATAAGIADSSGTWEDDDDNPTDPYGASVGGQEPVAAGDYIQDNYISGEDMTLLQQAGYDEIDLDLMDKSELQDAMEDAGVDTFMYDFDD